MVRFRRSISCFRRLTFSPTSVSRLASARCWLSLSKATACDNVQMAGSSTKGGRALATTAPHQIRRPYRLHGLHVNHLFLQIVHLWRSTAGKRAGKHDTTTTTTTHPPLPPARSQPQQPANPFLEPAGADIGVAPHARFALKHGLPVGNQRARSGILPRHRRSRNGVRLMVAVVGPAGTKGPPSPAARPIRSGGTMVVEVGAAPARRTWRCQRRRRALGLCNDGAAGK